MFVWHAVCNRLVDDHQHFQTTHWSHREESNSAIGLNEHWQWYPCVVPKQQDPTTPLHCATAQKSEDLQSMYDFQNTAHQTYLKLVVSCVFTSHYSNINKKRIMTQCSNHCHKSLQTQFTAITTQIILHKFSSDSNVTRKVLRHTTKSAKLVCVCVCVLNTEAYSLPANSLPTASCKLYKRHHIVLCCNTFGKPQQMNIYAECLRMASKLV